MNAGIWEIATAKLCGQCIRDMEDEYIFSPMWRRTLGGTCERCGENRIVHEVQYTMNKRGPHQAEAHQGRAEGRVRCCVWRLMG